MLSAGLGLGSAGLRSCKHACVNAHVRLLQHDHTHLMLPLLTNSIVCELSYTAHKTSSASWVIYFDKSMHMRHRPGTR